MTYTQRARLILHMRLNGIARHRIGERFGISAQRVSQIEEKEIKKVLDPYNPASTPEGVYLETELLASLYLMRKAGTYYLDTGDY